MTLPASDIERIELPVLGYEGVYTVDSQGNFYSFCSGGKKKLKTSITAKGYAKVSLSLKGETKTFRTHRIVADAFIPNPGNKTQVNHRNGIKTDNRAENLEWATSSENIKHAIDTGLLTIRFGDESNQHKLTSDIVKEIMNSRDSARILASRFSVSKAAVDKIRGGYTWTHITGLERCTRPKHLYILDTQKRKG